MSDCGAIKLCDTKSPWRRHPVRSSTSRKKLVRRVRFSTDLNNVASNQFAASSGFHLTVDLNFTALDQQFRLPACICYSTELQELIQPQRFTFKHGFG